MGQLVKFFRLWKKGQFMWPCIKQKKIHVIKETIAKINLDTNEIIKLSNDKMICNFVLSPNGKTLLCNFRTKGYWSVFDLKNKTEKKIKKSVINGYATTDEIVLWMTTIY